MKVCSTFLLLMVVAFAPGAVVAGPNVAHLNWGSHLNPSDCPDDQGYRYLEMNVTQHVTNDADQALDGPTPRYWARLDYNRHIQVWKVGISVPPGERYCVLVRYQGSWKTIAGGSPADPGTAISAGLEGTFQGGYRAVIEGQLNETGSVRLRGRIADANRNWSGMPYDPPAPDDWIDQYFFSGYMVTPVWWGWIYHGGPNSTYVHACDPSNGPECPGNSGNITD
jgi:hypothetical protein